MWAGKLSRSRLAEIEPTQVASVVEAFEVDGNAADEKLAEKVLQLQQSRPALEIGGDGQVRPVGKRLTDETRQDALRPHLDEDAERPPRYMDSISSRKRTGEARCRRSTSTTAAGSSGYGAAVVLAYTGLCGDVKA